MRAVICKEYSDPENLSVGELAAPEPQKGEVLIAVEAVGLGYVDALIVKGAYQVKASLPFVPGGELVGEVLALGDGVDTLEVGTRVVSLCQLGALAEQAAVPVSTCLPIPPELDSDVAAGMMISYCTGLYAFENCGQLQAGETVLILGASGGVGAAALDIAKCIGARVIAAASTKEKRTFCLERGADAVLDYTADNWRDELSHLTDGRGVDVIYDPVGGDMSEKAFRSMAVGGRFLVVGFTAGHIGSISLNLPLLKRASIIGVNLGAHVTSNPSENGRLIGKLMKWMDAGKIKPEATSIHSLEDASQVLKRLLARESIGKPVVRVQPVSE